MSKPKPQVVQTPYQGNTSNTFGTASIADTPEAKALMDVNLDIDPGVGRRADLAEQGMQNRWNSAFNSNVPTLLRQQNQESDRRQIQAQGGAEAQQAEYAKKMMDLERRKWMLPQVVQTGGSSSGFNSQAFQPQGNGILSGIAGAALGMIPKI
jgi:hypothetical protein